MAGRNLRAAHVHAAETRAGIRRVEMARHAGVINLDDGVVDDLGVAGDKFEGPDVARLRHLDRQHEIAERVQPLGREQVGLRQLDYQVGFAELPVFGPRRQRRQIRRIPLRGSAGRPLLEKGDLRRAQAPLADEFAVARRRQPGGHETTAGHQGDLFGAAGDIPVRKQRKGTRSAGAMAGGTVGKDERRNIPGKGHLRGRVRLFEGRPGIAPGQQGERQKAGAINAATVFHGTSGMKQPTPGTRGSAIGSPASTASRASCKSRRTGRARRLPKST